MAADTVKQSFWEHLDALRAAFVKIAILHFNAHDDVFFFNSFRRYSFSVFGINSVKVLNNLKTR